MALQGIADVSSNLTESQTTGPIFIDDAECKCALREELGKEAWRCTNVTSNIYLGQSGKWFFAVNQTDALSLKESSNSDSNPPNLHASYAIQSEGQNAKYVEVTLRDMDCSGVNDTEASTDFYTLMAAY